MLTVAVMFPQIEVISCALVITVFTFLAAPVAAHMIARAAYATGVQLWKKTTVDQLCNRYDRCTCTLDSCPIVDELQVDGSVTSERPRNEARIAQPEDAAAPKEVIE